MEAKQDDKKRSLLKQIDVPWQVWLVSYVVSVFLVPSSVGFIVYDATGSNGIANNAIMLSILAVIIVALFSWWVSLKREKQ